MKFVGCLYNNDEEMKFKLQIIYDGYYKCIYRNDYI